MRIGFEPRRPGVGVAAAVVALHLALALALLGSRAWPDRQTVMPTRAIEVRLLRMMPSAEMTRPAPEPGLQARVPPSIRRRSEPQSITLPSAAAAQPAPPAADLPMPGAATEPAAAPALRLELPRAASAPLRWRQPALDDPRANTARRTLEAGIADTMRGEDRLIEEPLGDGRIRYRRGSECLLVTPARGALIDPFNQSASPTPRLVAPC